MKILLAILGAVLVVPIALVVGIALGPAILVMLFIAGFALLAAGLMWAVDRARRIR